MELIHHRGISKRGNLPNSFDGVTQNRNGSIEADAVLLQDGTIAIFHERDLGLSLSLSSVMKLRDAVF